MNRIPKTISPKEVRKAFQAMGIAASTVEEAVDT